MISVTFASSPPGSQAQRFAGSWVSASFSTETASASASKAACVPSSYVTTTTAPARTSPRFQNTSRTP